MRRQMLDNLLALLDDQLHRFVPRRPFKLSILSDLLYVYSISAAIRLMI